MILHFLEWELNPKSFKSNFIEVKKFRNKKLTKTKKVRTKIIKLKQMKRIYNRHTHQCCHQSQVAIHCYPFFFQFQRILSHVVMNVHSIRVLKKFGNNSRTWNLSNLDVTVFITPFHLIRLTRRC